MTNQEKKIWIIKSQEPLPIKNDLGRPWRSGIFAKIISENLETNVIWWSSSFNHFKKNFHSKKSISINVSDRLIIKLLKTPGYKKNISLQRLFDHFIFGLSFFIRSLNQPKPKLIICAFPTFSSGLFTYIYSKIFKVPYIIDYRDHWPELFWENASLNKKKMIKKLSFFHVFFVKRILNSASSILSISDFFLDLALEKTNRKKNDNDSFIYIPYLKKTKINYSNVNNKIVSFCDLNRDAIFITYIGTIGYLCDVETIYKAAKEISNTNVCFLICGSGPFHKEWSEKYKSENILSTGFINNDEITYILKKSNAAILSYRNTEIWQKTIPNKFVEYLSEGLFLLNSLEKGLIFNEVKRYNLGLNFTEGDYKSLISLINSIDYDKIKLNKSLRLSYFDKKFSYENTVIELNNLIKPYMI